jgi:hypothetical protein
MYFVGVNPDAGIQGFNHRREGISEVKYFSEKESVDYDNGGGSALLSHHHRIEEGCRAPFIGIASTVCWRPNPDAGSGDGTPGWISKKSRKPTFSLREPACRPKKMSGFLTGPGF